jgi:hypothetical protein
MRKFLRAAKKEKGNKVSTNGLGTSISSLFVKVGFEAEIPELRGYTITPLSFDCGFDSALRRKPH